MNAPRLYPLMFMAVLIVAQFVFNALFPALRLWKAPLTWVGAAPLVIGLALVLTAAGVFRRRGTTLHPFGAPAVLVQNGLYRYTRNPMYLGMLLILTGVALGLGQVLAILMLPLFVAVIARQNIRHEEMALAAQFVEDYRLYCQRVRRWL